LTQGAASQTRRRESLFNHREAPPPELDTDRLANQTSQERNGRNWGPAECAQTVPDSMKQGRTKSNKMQLTIFKTL